MLRCDRTGHAGRLQSSENSLTHWGDPMPISRIDVIQLFDLDLSRRGRIPDPRKLLKTDAESAAYKRYVESFEWIFEAQSTPGDAKDRTIDPTLQYLSQRVNCPYSPPGFDRFALKKAPMDSQDCGGVITLSKDLQAGMVCTWQTYSGTGDALAIKHSLSVDIPAHYLKQLSGLFDYISEGHLMYPFIGLRYTSSELGAVLRDESTFLGMVLCGGLDHESDDTMRLYVSNGLSLRRYEGLFLHSSGGLGVYVSGVEPSAEADLELYERTLFRAVQVCEICLLEQRVLRTFKSAADKDAKKVRIFPRPFLIEKRREELLTLENKLVRSLPFRSPESAPLIRKAQEIFQVPSFLQDAKDSYNFLETRYQNTKTTALAAVAVLAYLLDKLTVWKIIAEWMAGLFHNHR